MYIEQEKQENIDHRLFEDVFDFEKYRNDFQNPFDRYLNFVKDREDFSYFNTTRSILEGLEEKYEESNIGNNVLEKVNERLLGGLIEDIKSGKGKISNEDFFYTVNLLKKIKEGKRTNDKCRERIDEGVLKVFYAYSEYSVEKKKN